MSNEYYELTFKMDALAREFVERVKGLPVSEYDDEITDALDTFHSVVINGLKRKNYDGHGPGWLRDMGEDSALELAFVRKIHRSLAHKALKDKR